MTDGLESVERALDEMRRLLGDLQQMSAIARVERERLREESRVLEEEAAEKRRMGEYGPDWQILQRRVDKNETTLFDIRCGIDKSPEARAVRDAMRANARPARRIMVEAFDDVDRSSGVREFHEANEALAQMTAEISALYDGADDWRP